MTDERSNPEPVDPAPALAETIEFLTLARRAPTASGPDEPPEWFGPYLFGGFVIAQAIAAATRDARAGHRLHSLHAYFLRPVDDGRPDRAPRAHGARRSDVRYPAGRDRAVRQGRARPDVLVHRRHRRLRLRPPGPHDVPRPRAASPSPGRARGWRPSSDRRRPRPDGTRESTHRMWFRIPAPLPDDPHLHAALLGFATDWTGIGGRPLHLDGDTTGMVSLDHAAWFHRPARADEWLLTTSTRWSTPAAAACCGRDARPPRTDVVASIAQEMRLTPVDPA